MNERKIINLILMQTWKHTALGSFANFSCILFFKIIWKCLYLIDVQRALVPSMCMPLRKHSLWVRSSRRVTLFSFAFPRFSSLFSTVFFFYSFLSTCSLYSCRDEGCLKELPQALYPSLPSLSHHLHFLSLLPLYPSLSNMVPPNPVKFFSGSSENFKHFSFDWEGDGNVFPTAISSLWLLSVETV